MIKTMKRIGEVWRGWLHGVASCPSKTQLCFRDGKWQVDELINLSEKLEREIAAIEDAVSASGTAIGDTRNHYTIAKRIRDITAQRDYFMRECDKARAANIHHTNPGK
jgi:NADH:ubiquinone oxidoreductase subunit